MGKNVAVFVDVANIFYAAKAAGVDIDYVTLLKSASAGRDLVRAYAYTGLDPDNENQRNFHSFLARNGYRVVSKDIRKYGDGKVKANLDIELVVDMMKTARNLDIAIVVSGDGDFAPAIRAVQEMGVRCEVISFRGNTSSDLIEVADLFTDITQLAKVEKGSRSGRRIAEDNQDLSMTEVPDKQTEGSGRGRGRGRGRERGAEREPVAAGTRSRRRSAGTGEAVAAASANIVALPGERLSRVVVGDLTEADLARAEVFRLDDDEADVIESTAAEAVGSAADGGTDEGQRRRRRRGGRGRGRGRGRAEGEAVAEAEDESAADQPIPTAARRGGSPRGEPRLPEEDELPAPRIPRSTPFGSVWDSQLGTSTPSSSSLAPLSDEEDFEDEPEIPEYLIAERNRSRAGRGRGGARGGRSAYQSAISRERYGRGGGGGINRYPDVSERTSARPPARREERGPRPERAPAVPAAGRTGGEWSEVPPELEELLRAQLTQKATPTVQPAEIAETPRVEAEPAPAAVVEAEAPKRRTTRRTKAAAAEEAPTEGMAAAEETPAPRPRTRRKAASSEPAAEAVPVDETAPAAETASPTRRRTTRKTAAAAAAEPTASDEAASAAAVEVEAAAPRRRTTRKTAAPADAATATAEPDAAPKPRRRTPRTAAPTDTA